MLIVHRAGLAGLLLGVVVCAASAQKPAESSAWWPTFWGEGKPKTGAESRKEAPRVNRAAEQGRLEKVYLRRQAVCDRLREVALESNDRKLEEEAVRLEQVAWKLFQSASDRLLSAGTADDAKPGVVIDETRDMLLDDAKRKREGRR